MKEDRTFAICEYTGKRCYSKKEANIVKNCAIKYGHRKKIPLRAYYCEHCGTFHLTHFKKPFRRQK